MSASASTRVSAKAARHDERRAARGRAALTLALVLALAGAVVLAAPAHASLPRLDALERPALAHAPDVPELELVAGDVGSLDAEPDVPDPPLPLLDPAPRTDYGELFARELVLDG